MCLWKPPRRFFIACFPNILASFVFEVHHRIGFDGTQGRQVLGQSKPRALLSSVPRMLARNDALYLARMKDCKQLKWNKSVLFIWCLVLSKYITIQA